MAKKAFNTENFGLGIEDKIMEETKPSRETQISQKNTQNKTTSRTRYEQKNYKRLALDQEYVNYSFRIRKDLHTKLGNYANTRDVKTSMGLILNELIEQFLFDIPN